MCMDTFLNYNYAILYSNVYTGDPHCMYIQYMCFVVINIYIKHDGMANSVCIVNNYIVLVAIFTLLLKSKLCTLSSSVIILYLSC